MDKHLHIRMDAAQLAKIEQAAKEQGISVSAFVRQAVLNAVKRVKA